MNKFSHSAGNGRLLLPFLAILLSILLLYSLSGAELIAAQEPVLPLAPPDGVSGLEVYEARCANCHGPQGNGDGELAGNLPAPPRDFTNSEFRRVILPSMMFDVITNGRLEQGMPPFGPTSSNPLAEVERWDSIAAVYSLATPPEAIASGEALYAENCAACHGESGQGDGPDAADDAPPGDLTSLSYWFNRSNDTVFASLQDAGISAHTYDLTEDELWDVVDYTRTFSYAYADPPAAAAPIAAGTITGLVTNGSTSEPIGEGTATLRAFTPEFTEALTLSTTVGTDGRYSFDVTDVDPDWVYFVSVRYGDLSFSSNPEQLQRSEPTLELPVTVFDKTSDVTAVGIEQIHMILQFASEDRVQVNELYVFSNTADQVFVGESGDPQEGTVEVVVPTGAENVTFQRSFDTLDSFLPATEFFQTDRGWADTMPLRAGPSAMNLLVTYELPYESGMTLAHPVFYDTRQASLIMSDVGVRPSNPGWVEQPAQQMGSAGTLLSFARDGIPADGALTLQLEGRPNPAAAGSTASTAVAPMSTTTQLVIGIAALLLVAAGGVYAVRTWRQPDVDEEDDTDPQELVQAIANLDEAFEAGKMDETSYRKQRAALVGELAALWQASSD